LRTSDAGIALIKQFEGVRLDAYVCPAGVLTIGYGHTGDDVYEGQVINHDEADALLRADLAKFERCVGVAVNDVTQQQFDACVSLAFNIGCAAFGKSTLARKIAQGDVSGAADEFLRWNRGGGKVLPGLTRRREAERALFLS
jgi:lysozyme